VRQLLRSQQTNLKVLRERFFQVLRLSHLQEYLVQRFLDEVSIGRALAVWSETRVDHWLHALAKLGELRRRDLMNHHAPVNLRDDDHDSDQMALKMQDAKMKGDRMKRMKKDGWMDGQNLGDRNRGAVVSHPFRTPLFRF